MELNFNHLKKFPFLFFLFFCSLILAPVSKAWALDPGDVTITMTTAPFYTVDSNGGCSVSPNAAFIGFQITNASGATLTNLYVNLGNFTHAAFGMAGGQDSLQYIGTLTNGASDVVYWYTLYDCDNNNIPACSDMTVTVNDANPGVVTATQNMCTRSSISANAGGLLLSQTIYAANIVGGLASIDVEYEFGGVAIGDEYNIQPAGNLGFDASCFQLLNCKVISSGVTAIPVNTTDDLYYVAAAKQTGSGHAATIRYYYRSLCVGGSTVSHAYASQTSGATNMKHTSNIGDGTNPNLDFAVPSSLDSFTVKKSVSSAYYRPGDTATYTITVINNSSDTASFDQITDTLPSPLTFVAIAAGSGITGSNATSLPSQGDGGTLIFKGGGTSSIFPYTEFVLENGDSIKLIFTAAIPSNANYGNYTNKATITAGVYSTPDTSTLMYVGPDADGDGLIDLVDLDSDNDGIPDYQEICGATATSFSCMPGGYDPSGDEDGDGIPNYNDADDVNFTATCTDGNSDGICDVPVSAIDTDGDSIPDHLDIDSDNDGIPDLVEAGGTDTDGDGTVDATTDTDGDGLVDILDNNDTDGPLVSGCTFGVDCSLSGSTSVLNDTDNNGAPTIIDADGDLIPDYQDLDSDNDGIPDVVEVGGTDANGDGIADNFADTDGDGLNDVIDGDVGNDGTAENSAQALLLTGTDTNSNGFPNSYPGDDADGDAVLNFKDLDSDNDGIPDVVEAGGTDANGDGYADDFVDSDGDGLNDVVDGDVGNDGTAENTSQALQITSADANSNGAPDSNPVDDNDGDGILNQYDLDADGDGILDVTEAGGTDANRDGIADSFTDTDGDGLNDGLDGDVGNDGTAENSAAALMNTGADANSDGAPDSYTEGDFDSDLVPTFLDVDSDNDGIFDIYEAQATTGYTPPSGTDSDGDGIDNVYDDDDVNYGGTGAAGLVPVNTDASANADYLDTDSDDDGVPDMQEAWDSLADGDSSPDGVTGSCTADADGDGLVDCFDSNDADATVYSIAATPPTDDGTGGANGTSSTGVNTSASNDMDDIFPANNLNGGADNTQPDYRDTDNVNCAASTTWYAITEGDTTNDYHYVTGSGIHTQGSGTAVVRATNLCEKAGGWYRFYNPLQSDKYILSIKNGTNTVPLEEVIDFVEVQTVPAPVRSSTATEGVVLMRRAWYIQAKGSLNGTVSIRFYYPQAEWDALQDSALALQSDVGGSVDYTWFKTDDAIDYGAVPTKFADYANNFIDLNVSVSSENPGGGDTETGGAAKNYVQIDGLTSFSGGTFGSQSGTTLPVELLEFEAQHLSPFVQLNWKTASELNSDYFQVERSLDTKHFESVGKIQAAGTSTSLKPYSLLDQTQFEPGTRRVYYRIRMVDIDGSFDLSNLVEVSLSPAGIPLRIFPNPAKEQMSISYQMVRGQNASLRIIDTQGKLIYFGTLTGKGNEQTLKLTIKDWSPGMYQIILSSTQGQVLRKFVKE